VLLEEIELSLPKVSSVGKACDPWSVHVNGAVKVPAAARKGEASFESDCAVSVLLSILAADIIEGAGIAN